RPHSVFKGEFMIFKRRTRNFKTLTCLFFLLSFSISLFLNLRSYEEKTGDRIFFQVYLTSDISKEKKQGIEEKILGFENVKKVGYISREESRRKLEKDLKITIPDSSIQDIIVVYFSSEISPEMVISELETENEIQEIFFDQEYVEKSLLENKIFKFMRYLTGIFLIAPIIGIIFSSYISMGERNLIYFYFTSKERDRISQKSWRACSLPLIFSAIIGFLAYNNIYMYVQKKLEKINYFILKSPFEKVFLFTIVVTVCVVLIALISTFSKKSLDSGDSEDEE
ncbi:MAG: cell division protein FtsX, partial [Fusobacteriaceae bacterium]